jgi:hypothetical protein
MAAITRPAFLPMIEAAISTGKSSITSTESRLSATIITVITAINSGKVT